MKCFKPIIYQKYLDNELKEKERAKVKSHLENCKKCSKTLENLKIEEMRIKKFFEEEKVDFSKTIMEIISKSKAVRKSPEFKIYYLLLLSISLLPVIFWKYVCLTPLLGDYLMDFFSHLFSFSSVFFSLLRVIFNLDIRVILIHAVIFSILTLAMILITNIKIKTEVWK
ncbi:MAG: zf-HC2 domain-containing protein [Candidatus Aminicenantia bacterium]